LCYLRLGDAYFFGGEYQGALNSYHEAVRRLRRLFESISAIQREQLVAAQAPSSHITPELILRLPRLNLAKTRDRLGALDQLGETFSQCGFDDQATAIYIVTVDVHRPIVPQFPDDNFMQSSYGHLLEDLGDQYVRRNLGGATALYAEAHRVLRNLPVRSASDEQFRQLVTAIVESKIQALKAAR
jgi:tetratricopeptide (TPR) repeat protein